MKYIEVHHSDVHASSIGRTFATKRACELYCRRNGFQVMAKIQFEGSDFCYAPYLITLEDDHYEGNHLNRPEWGCTLCHMGLVVSKQ